MPRTYTDLRDLIEQKLEDTSNAEFTVAQINYELEESLKEYGSYQKHENLIPVIYKMESRQGVVTATSSNNLTDTTKSQFVAGDATDEKVVHNTTDDTRAVIASYTSSSVLALNKDIFAIGDSYRIYNKRCSNQRQIYIGDVTDYLRIASVEYPIGRAREFNIVNNNILEINVAMVWDTNPTFTNLNPADVAVVFAKPHILSQLTDWAGEVNNGAGYAAGVTSMAVDGLGATETIEEGEVFTIENHRTYYTITADVTTSANAATITFYPGLEAAVVDNDDITFVKSTLKPDDEDFVAELTAARLMVNKAVKFVRSGRGMADGYANLGERKLAQLRSKMRGQAGARTTYHHSRF